MPYREYREWQAYEAVTGPLGPGRADYLAAMMTAAILNANRAKKSRPVKPEKLLLWPVDRPGRPEQTPEEMLRAIKAANRALGGEEVRRGNAGGPRHPDPGQAGLGQEGLVQAQGESR